MLNRRVLLGVAALVLALAVFVIVSSIQRETHRQAAATAVAKPFVDQGWTVVETSQRGDPTKLEANVEAGCVVAVSVNPAKLRVAHPAGIVEGDGPVLTCLCQPGSVTVTSPKEAGGMVLLRTDASNLGGSRAFPFLPFKAGTTAANDAACAEASLEAWLGEKKYPAPTVDNAILDAKPQLKKAGMTVAGIIKPEWPLAVVDVPANDCLLGIDSDDKLEFRTLLGPATGNLAYCTTKQTTVVVSREGSGLVNLLLAPAASVGGLQGLTEIAATAGIAIANLGVPPTDHDWIAKQLLLASDIPDSLIVVGRDSNDADLRIASLSSEKPNMLTPETGEGVFSFCEASLCIFSGPQKWKLERHDAITGLARAKLPFWLFGIKDVAEPAALKLATQVISLSRHLKREGFEPTTFEAVTENDTGAEVLGRANEDMVIAVTLAPTAPWVIPLADEGTWTLDGEPKSAAIKPLQRIQLLPPPKTKLPPKATRRTVVFRHHA